MNKMIAHARTLLRLLLTLGLATVACATQAHAAGNGALKIEKVFQGIPHDALYDVAFEGSRGLAAGDFGLILSTQDAGRHWERNDKPFTDLALLGISMQAGRCIITGQSGHIYVSNDCRDWRPVESHSDARLMSVDMNRHGIAVTVGGFGEILKSTDWGESWTAVPVFWDDVIEDFIEPHLYDVEVDDNGAITIVGEFELIIRSVDGGASWNVVHRGERSLFAMTLLDNGLGYTVGQEGAVLRTADHGVSWQSLDTGSDAIFLDVWATAPGVVMVVGIRALLRSGDGGQSWTASTAPQFADVWFQALGAATENTINHTNRADQQNIYAVGHSGTALNITW